MTMWYFKIYDWMLEDLHLKGAELLVFAYLYMWSENGKECTQTQGQIADKLGIGRRTYNDVAKKIVQKLHIENVQKLHKDVCKNCTLIVQKLHKGMCKNCTSTINKNIKEKKEKGKNARARENALIKEKIIDEKATEQTTASSIEQRRLEIILQGIADHYTQRGDLYVPNYATQTTIALSLINKISTLMQHFGVEDNDEQFADTWRRFLTAGYESGDQFQREHWTLDYIDKQFMSIYNRLINGTKKGTNNGGKGKPGVSSEYVHSLMRKAGIII